MTLNWRATDTPEDRAAAQRDLDRMEGWASRNPTEFRRNEYNAMCLGGQNPPAVVEAEEQLCRDSPRGVGRELSRTQPGAMAVMMASSILGCCDIGCTGRSTVRRLREEIIPLTYSSSYLS